jgi:rhodanese-related sulfurtransferase
MKHSEGFLRLVQEARGRVREATVAQVRERQAQGRRFEFIDVREDHEWAEGRAQGARHLGRGILERDIEKLIPDRDAEVVLYCGGGYRSALSADSLQKMGYRNVWSMAGGFRAWKEAGLPVEKG